MNYLLTPTKIILCKRRTIALIVNNKGELIVRAPQRAKESEINAFINEKQNWIISKRKQMLNSVEKSKLNLDDGSTFSILGESFVIKKDNCKTAKLKDGYLILPNNETEKSLVRLLKRLLRRYLEIKVKDLAISNGFNYKSISISSAKTNWGSCGGKNSLNFTYKLALCPKSVVDYIVVHELCHTRVKNHSSKFWNEVKKIFPEYKHCEKWLKENRAIVNLI